MGAAKRLVAVVLGMFLGYAVASYILYKAKQGIAVYPQYSNYNIFTALTSGHFIDWVKWNFLHYPLELTWFFVIVGGLLALAIAR